MESAVPRGDILVRAAALLCAACGLCADAPARLAARVVDENNVALQGVRVVVRRGSAPEIEALTDSTGRLEIEVVAPGEYLLDAEKPGFFKVERRVVTLAEGLNEITVVMNTVREVVERLDLAYSPPVIDYDRSTPPRELDATHLMEIPYPSTNTLRNAFRVVPGVVQDSRGGIHLNGGNEEQVLYMLDGFQINDPLTGRFETRLSVEAVRSLEVAAHSSAEYGKGAAGTIAIKTAAGDDEWRASATNFVPGIEHRKSLLVGSWTPRVNFSGPLWRGRAWFSDGLALQYDQYVVDELPKGEDRTKAWRVNNLLRTQVNLSSSNILTTGLFTGFWTAPRNGLGVLDPPSTTMDRRSRHYMFYVKDQMYLTKGILLDAGYSTTRTFGREIPQGRGWLIYTPDGREGFSFYDTMRWSSRDQVLANVSLTPRRLAGEHQVRFGTEFSVLGYRQEAERTGYTFLNALRRPTRSVTFGGSGKVRQSNTEFASYVQDSWRLRPGLLVELGLRSDWDRVIGTHNFSPRTGVSWAPPGLKSTKAFASFGVVYEQTLFGLISRPWDQYTLSTYYGPDGAASGGPALSLFLEPDRRLARPRYVNWTAGLERQLPWSIYGRIQYMRRRTSNGLTYINGLDPASPPPPDFIAAYGAASAEALFRLENTRRDAYDAVELTLKQNFRKRYEWMASYTRSRAASNAVNDIRTEFPLLVSDNEGRMPWDAPNRFLSWGYLPAFSPSWAVAYLLETRDGFPFSIYDEKGSVLGRPSERRFPAFFELSVFLERRFVSFGHRWAARFGFFNVTNHKNPNVVIADASSPRFMTMFGGQSRAFNVRIRWLGKR